MNSLGPAIVASLLVHAVLVGVGYYLGELGPRMRIDKPIITARFVRQGEERDKALLPRKDVSEAPADDLKVKEKEVHKEAPKKVEPEKKQVTKGKNLPAPLSKGGKKKSGAERLAELSKKWKKEGSKDANPLGMDLQGDLAMGYEEQVAEMIRRHYELPSVLNFNEQRGLVLLVKLTINPNGKLQDIKIIRSSKNGTFDNAVLLGAKGVPSFGPPPLPLRKQYMRDGLTIQFCPVKCEE